MNCLPLHCLQADDSVTSQVCKILNYYNSLDWLDESITRFYRKDSMDLENALSEHFARCLQWQSGTKIVEDTFTLKNAQHASQTLEYDSQEDASNNNHETTKNYFDFLELELSSFVVKGSALFFRGLLVQSNLANYKLSLVYHQLFSKGFLALSKHLQNDLVYFTSLKEFKEMKIMGMFYFLIY